MNDEIKNKSELLKEAKNLCQKIKEKLPKRNDPAKISLTAKIPYKAIDYRNALIWRGSELGHTSIEMYERCELASAVILTRALMETVAAMWYLKGKIEFVSKTKEVGEIDNTLMKLLMGSRNDLTNIDSINVLTFVQRINKDINSFLKNYEVLSEYAHPNFSGTCFLYSKPDYKRIWTDFGKKVNDIDFVSKIGLINLTASLEILEYSFNEIGDLMPAFIGICEKDIIPKNI